MRGTDSVCGPDGTQHREGVGGAVHESFLQRCPGGQTLQGSPAGTCRRGVSTRGPSRCPQITWTARYGSQAGSIQPAEVQQEVVVSYLPLSHIAAQIYDLWTGIQWGAQVCFAQPDALKVSLPSARLGGSPDMCRGHPRRCSRGWAYP